MSTHYNKETLTLENGYKGIFRQCDGPQNPLRDDYGHPPTLTRFWDRSGWSKWDCPGSLKFDWQTLYALIPDVAFSESAIEKTLHAIGPDDLPPIGDLEADAVQWGSSLKDVVRDAIKDTEYPDKMDFLETLASLAGIYYLGKESTGYCQGDYCQSFSAILPDWIQETGCPPKHFESAMKETARQYSAWAWGSVYFLETLIRPDGTEIEAADLGFSHDHYGWADRPESGCMETLREAAACDAATDAKERAEREAWEARDSVTV
jgi:hypothetical protein